MDHCSQPVICDFSNIVANEVEIETNNDLPSGNTKQISKRTIELPFFEETDYSNGALYDELNYCWSQTFTEIEIHVRLPAKVIAKHLKVNITNTSINVHSLMNGERQEIVCGQLSEKCKALDAVWTITEGNKLNISLEKTKEIWWKKLLETEPDIDVQRIDCSRPMEELSEQTQAHINRIQFDEQQKMKGELTSEQIKQQKMLRKAWDAEGSPFKGQPFDPNIVQFEN